jgi:hypothetical protein
MKMCSGDPLVCIDFVVLFIGEFLKDWTTMAMLAALLGLLLKLRADKQQMREDQYAKRLEAYDERRNQEPSAPA